MRHLFSSRIFVFICFLFGAVHPAVAKSLPKLDHQVVKKIAKQALDENLILYSKPQAFIFRNEVEDGKIVAHYYIAEIANYPTPKDFTFKRYLYPIQHQIKIELYRRHLFSDDADKKFMKPYLDSEEKEVQLEMDIAHNHKGTYRELEDKFLNFNSGLPSIQNGIQKLAEKKGYRLKGTAPARVPRPSTVLSKEGAEIEIVQFTMALVSKSYGITENDEDFPWDTYNHGAKVRLGGVYKMRVKNNGKVGKSVKRIVSFDGEIIKLHAP